MARGPVGFLWRSTDVLSFWIAPLSAMPGDPIAADPDPGPSGPESDPSPLPPEPLLPLPLPAPLGLDRQGLLEAAAGTVIALIALFPSYDHITAIGRTIPLQQQWGVWLIAASLALVLVDAQLATRSRSREKARLDRDEHRFLRAEDSRQREAHEADRERNRAAERAERQRQGIARLHACALLGGRFQLDPSPANALRYRAVLALMAEAPDSGV